MRFLSANKKMGTFCGYTRRECLYLGCIFLVLLLFRLCWYASHTPVYLVGTATAI